jgi:sensor histidine kinase YesM
MIVENAIKHGITQKESGGTVTISTRDTGDSHTITVTDDGVGFDVNTPRPESGSHIGLANLSSRLSGMMGGMFEISSEIGVGTTAKVIIPKD